METFDFPGGDEDETEDEEEPEDENPEEDDDVVHSQVVTKPGKPK